MRMDSESMRLALKVDDYALCHGLCRGLRYKRHERVMALLVTCDALYNRVLRMDLKDWEGIRIAMQEAKAIRDANAAGSAIDGVLNGLI